MNKSIFLKKFLLVFLFFIGSVGVLSCAERTTNPRQTIQLPNPTEVSNFGSYDELKVYLETLYDDTGSGYIFKNAGSRNFFAMDSVAEVGSMASYSSSTTSEVDRTHSETNNQVEGVAEHDSVLTDGYRIYITTWSHFFILNADTLAIEYTYQIENGYITGMFLEEGRIVLLGYEYTYEQAKTGEDVYYWYHYSYGTRITVFDVSGVTDLVEPTIEKELFFDNTSFVDARMIEGYVYLILNNYAINYGFMEDSFIPVYRDSTVSTEDIAIPAENIYVMPNDNLSVGYLLLVSFSVANEEAAQVDAYLGSSYQIFMSLNNLYTSTYRYDYDEETEMYNYYSYILRFAIDEDHKLVYQAMGVVSGSPLNQFSMDEFEGTFRIATTGYSYNSVTFDSTIDNFLYVLNATTVDEMTLMGSLTGLGKPNERIYSCRFNGEYATIVTYFQTDPMYLIHLSNPYYPHIEDELSEDGVSDYQHPIGTDLILGIGRADTDTSIEVSRLSKVKVELYQKVGSTLTSLGIYLTTGEYSYTNVAWDHKSFMSFTPEGEDFTYITIPVFEYNNQFYNSTQNLYVFKVYHAGTFEFITKLSHMDETNSSWYYYFDSIDRSIIVGDHIYTVSNNKIQMFDMSNDFAFVAKTELEAAYTYNWID